MFGESLDDKFAGPFHYLRPFLLVKNRVIRSGKNVHPLHGRRETVKEFPLRRQTDDPVATGTEHERRQIDRTRIREQTGAGIVQID